MRLMLLVLSIKERESDAMGMHLYLASMQPKYLIR